MKTRKLPILALGLIILFCLTMIIPVSATTWYGKQSWGTDDEVMFNIWVTISGSDSIDAGDTEDYYIEIKLTDWKLPETGDYAVFVYQLKVDIDTSHVDVEPEKIDLDLIEKDLLGVSDGYIYTHKLTLSTEKVSKDDRITMKATFYYEVWFGYEYEESSLTATAKIDYIGYQEPEPEPTPTPPPEETPTPEEPTGWCFGTILIAIIPIAGIIGLVSKKRNK